MLEQIKIEYTNSIKILDNIENINKLVKKVLGEALRKEKIPFNFFFLVVFVTPEEIKEKNNKYRNVNKTTDVLSFPVFSKEEIKQIIDYHESKNKNSNKGLTDLPIDLRLYLEDEWSIGEIYINLEKVEEQALEYNHSITRELSYILVHGFYHLLGEDHIETDDKRVMREKEENILKTLDIIRDENKENNE